jgi:hypothetical protein
VIGGVKVYVPEGYYKHAGYNSAKKTKNPNQTTKNGKAGGGGSTNSKIVVKDRFIFQRTSFFLFQGR